MSDEAETAVDQDAMAEDWAAAMEEQGADEPQAADNGNVGAFKQVKARSLDEGRMENQADVNLDVILDIPITIAMEIGRTKLSIRNLLQLNQGSVVELDRLAGEPMDVLVNGTLVAHGEVVVVNEKFGIRLTDVISPADRIKNLR